MQTGGLRKPKWRRVTVMAMRKGGEERKMKRHKNNEKQRDKTEMVIGKKTEIRQAVVVRLREETAAALLAVKSRQGLSARAGKREERYVPVPGTCTWSYWRVPTPGTHFSGRTPVRTQ